MKKKLLNVIILMIVNFNYAVSQGNVFPEGNVGLGTLSPQNKLDVNGNASIGFSILPYTAPVNGLVVSGNVGIGNAAPNPSAVVDISSTNQGVLIPRMSYIQRTTGITSPATGLLVYQTEDLPGFPSGFYYFDGTIWKKLETSLSSSSPYPVIDCNTFSETQGDNVQAQSWTLPTSGTGAWATATLNAQAVSGIPTTNISRTNNGIRLLPGKYHVTAQLRRLVWLAGTGSLYFNVRFRTDLVSPFIVGEGQFLSTNATIFKTFVILSLDGIITIPPGSPRIYWLEYFIKNNACSGCSLPNVTISLLGDQEQEVYTTVTVTRIE